MNIFAIGDIHGCIKQLVTLQDKIFNYPQYNKEEDLLLYLGDYIDRGPGSKDVINHILQLQTEGIKSIFLMGNHEQFMIDFLFNKINNLNNWIINGADQTFKSYDIEIAEFIKDGFEDDNIDKLRNIFLSKLTKEHVYFFNNLKLTYIMGDYLFVHAGINPEKSLSEQNKIDFLWSRSDQFFDKNFKFEKIIVHGHSPEKEVINFPYRINVDTGSFFSGKLSCVCLNDKDKKREFIYS
jgi:serine/threonine protein phosphatase 1